MRIIHKTRKKNQHGFTLLELVLALTILSMLIGMVAAISYSSINLSMEMVQSQRVEMRNQAFLGWVRRFFGSLPGNAKWEITSTKTNDSVTSQAALTDIIIQDVPLSLHWNDSPMLIKAIRIRSQKQKDGLLEIVMECYDEDLFDPTKQEQNALNNIEPVATTVLLSGLRYCEWTVRDPSTDEWSYQLKRTDNRPYQLELNLAFGDSTDYIREVYWIPPKQDPRNRIQEMQTGAMRGGNRPPNGGHNNGGQGGQTPPPLPQTPPPAGQ